MGLVVGNLAWRNVEFGKFRMRRHFTSGQAPSTPTRMLLAWRNHNGVISWHNLISAHLRMAFRGEKANQVCPLEFLNSKIQVLALAFTLTAEDKTKETWWHGVLLGLKLGHLLWYSHFTILAFYHIQDWRTHCEFRKSLRNS